MRSLRDLVNSLECLGVQTPFSVGAIFAKLSDLPVMFSDVQHGAVVSINEDDTEAAAATAVVLREGGLFIEPKKSREVRANHPFALLLLHSVSRSEQSVRDFSSAIPGLSKLPLSIGGIYRLSGPLSSFGGTKTPLAPPIASER